MVRRETEPLDYVTVAFGAVVQVLSLSLASYAMYKKKSNLALRMRAPDLMMVAAVGGCIWYIANVFSREHFSHLDSNPKCRAWRLWIALIIGMAMLICAMITRFYRMYRVLCGKPIMSRDTDWILRSPFPLLFAVWTPWGFYGVCATMVPTAVHFDPEIDTCVYPVGWAMPLGLLVLGSAIYLLFVAYKIFRLKRHRMFSTFREVLIGTIITICTVPLIFVILVLDWDVKYVWGRCLYTFLCYMVPGFYVWSALFIPSWKCYTSDAGYKAKVIREVYQPNLGRMVDRALKKYKFDRPRAESTPVISSARRVSAQYERDMDDLDDDPLSDDDNSSNSNQLLTVPCVGGRRRSRDHGLSTLEGLSTAVLARRKSRLLDPALMPGGANSSLTPPPTGARRLSDPGLRLDAYLKRRGRERRRGVFLLDPDQQKAHSSNVDRIMRGLKPLKTEGPPPALPRPDKPRLQPKPKVHFEPTVDDSREDASRPAPEKITIVISPPEPRMQQSKEEAETKPDTDRVSDASDGSEQPGGSAFRARLSSVDDGSEAQLAPDTSTEDGLEFVNDTPSEDTIPTIETVQTAPTDSETVTTSVIPLQGNKDARSRSNVRGHRSSTDSSGDLQETISQVEAFLREESASTIRCDSIEIDVEQTPVIPRRTAPPPKPEGKRARSPSPEPAGIGKWNIIVEPEMEV